MNHDREFQAQLRSWFDESSTPAEPEALLATLLAATARSRPRPAWLARLRGEPMPQEVGSSLSRMVVIGLGAAALVVAIALGRGLITRPTQNIGTGTPVPLPTQVAAPTASPSSQAMTFSKVAGYQARLVSDTVGWLSTGSRLYRTADAGRTWTEIAMPDNVAPAATSVVDADTAFVAFFKGRAWTIAATHDAGLSWTEVGVDALLESAQVTFAMQTPTIGAVAFSTGKVFETTDGGASWSGPRQTTTPDVGAFLFKSFMGDRGVITYSNGKYDNRPFDDRWWLSVDAGQTWRELSFPTDSVSTAGELKGMAGTPWLDGDRMIIAVNVEEKGATAFYTSSDAGRSWRFIHQIPNWQGGVTFLSPNAWAGCSNGTGARCWSTIDGGTTWKNTTISPVLDRLGQVTFGSVTHAWGVLDCTAPAWRISAQCDPSVKSMLLETTDGGATWRPIG